MALAQPGDAVENLADPTSAAFLQQENYGFILTKRNSAPQEDIAHNEDFIHPKYARAGGAIRNRSDTRDKAPVSRQQRPMHADDAVYWTFRRRLALLIHPINPTHNPSLPLPAHPISLKTHSRHVML